MNIDFFETCCKEPPRRDRQFGICDDQNGTKAYTDTADSSKWIAKITNNNEIHISFTPIDNCTIILKEGTNDKESTCDGMLTFKKSLYLVELKNQGAGGWITKAKEQLENTIRLILKHNDISEFRYKKAFACNKRHPKFHTIDSSTSKSFFQKTGFRLDVRAEIIIRMR
jgi:hypothetical protein